jgi:hypothetical protein
MQNAAPRPETVDLPVEETEVHAIDAWLQAFRVQCAAVEKAMHEKRSLFEREEILYNAQAAMPDEAFDDVLELEKIANLLDDKFDEMLSVLLKRATGLLSNISLPPKLEIPVDLELLRNPICRVERRWLFVGRMLEILDQYRGRGHALVLEQRNRLLKNLVTGVKTVTSTVQKLDSYLVVEQAFDLGQREQITQLLATLGQLPGLYQETLQSRGAGGLTAVLEKNAYTLKGQFLLACAKLSFQLYGHVAIEHLEALLTLKSLYILQVPGTTPDPDSNVDTEYKYLDRIMQRALAQVTGRAQRESWVVLPVLHLYKYNTRFGRMPARQRVGQDDHSSAHGALTSHGTSLISNL